ncbi:MAG: tetratricopeptide repeat protein, partial [Floccifex sp.]
MGLFRKKKEVSISNGIELYEKGKKAYQEKEYAQANEYLLQACPVHVEAVLFLGKLYCDGFLNHDEKDAFELYEKYVDQIKKDSTYSKVMHELAKCYCNGMGTKKDRIQAIKKMELCRVYDKSFDEIEYHTFIANCYIELWNDIYTIKIAKEANRLDEIKDEMQEDAYNFMYQKKYYNKYDGVNYPLILNHTGRKGFRHFELAGELGDPYSSYVCANIVAIPEFRNQYSEPVYKYLKMANDGGIHVAAADMYWRYINGFYQLASPSYYEMEDTVKRLKAGANAGNGDCQLALALCYTSNFINAYSYAYNMGR